MGEWLPIESAPRDGTWVLIEGEFCGGDTSSVRVARYMPEYTETGLYEWQVIDCDYSLIDDTVSLKDVMNNRYCEGRVFGWQPLPAPPAK